MPIGTIEVPVTHVTDEPTICIPVNVDWIPAVLAMVSPARYPEFWAGTLSENRRARLEVQNLIYLISNGGFCDMATCCTPPYIIQRINPETGMVEISTNNGDSWQPKPDGLPTVIVEPAPPVDNGVAATKCDAAQNAETQIEGWITHVTNDFDTAVDIFAFGSAVIAAIADAVLLILSAGTLTLIEAEIITAIGAAITGAWLAGKTIFSNYWTDDVKHQILCSLFNNIGDNGSFTDAQFSAFWADMNLHLPGAIAKMLFMGFMSSIGRQGLNAMAASGNSSGSDCVSCTPDCEDKFTWPTSTFGANGTVVIDNTEHSITAEAIESNPGTWYWAFESDTCCTGTVEITVGTPTIFFRGVIPCPDKAEFTYGDESSPPWTIFTLPIVNTAAFVFYMHGDAPFTAKVTFS